MRGNLLLSEPFEKLQLRESNISEHLFDWYILILSRLRLASIACRVLFRDHPTVSRSCL